MARSGVFRDRAAFERKADGVKDKYGVVYDGWSPLVTLWADVIERTGREALKSGAVESNGFATIRLRSSVAARAILASDRVTFRDEVWNIRSISGIGRKNSIIEILAEKGLAT